jgi:hypothetical protein
MNPEKFEYEPLENVFRGFEIDPHNSTTAELKQSLVVRGLDPDGTVSAVQELVAGYVKSKRLSWKDAAIKKRTEMMEVTQRLVSWASKGEKEVEAAFAKLRNGTYGLASNVAFRNLGNLSIEEKARILDDVDSLSEVARTKPGTGENP